jgi:hypothetical protein
VDRSGLWKAVASAAVAYHLLRMKLWQELGARRRRKAHERYLRERERQRELEGQDPQEAVRRVAQRSGASQQGMYGQGP